MKRCEKCGVLIPSSRTRCPLCQKPLSENQVDVQGYNNEIFPYIPTVRHRHSLLIRTAMFLSVTSCIICLALNFLFWKDSSWSLFVVVAEAAGWLTVAQAIRKRSTFCKHVLYQLATTALIVVVFDLLTGFHRWSFNYVIPALCVFSMLVIASIAAVGHREVENYIIYMVDSALFGIGILLFWLFGWTEILWPTIITAAAGVIYLAGLLLFIGRDTIAELRRRFHM